MLAAALQRGGDFAEIFAEDRRSCAATYDDSKIEELTSGRSRGAGIRVISGDATGFAHTADLSESGLLAAAVTAADATRGTSSGTKVAALSPQNISNPSVTLILPETVEKARKVEMLARVDAVARSVDNHISQVACRYGDNRRTFVVANSRGIYGGDDQVKSSFSVTCVAVGDGGMQTGRESIGHTVGFEIFERYDVEELAPPSCPSSSHQAEGTPRPVWHDAGSNWQKAEEAFCSTKLAVTAS